MEYDKFHSCTFKDRFYPHGAEISEKGEVMECVDGKWETVMLVSGI